MKTNSPTEQEIAHRAREIWQHRGEPAGQDTVIWLEAERLLTASQAIPDDETIKATLQKREARAPQVAHTHAPHAKPPETGKPIWPKSRSS